MGYVQAARGLDMQAEATLGSDGLVVATTVDNWATNHTRELEALAAHKSLQRVLVAGSGDADPGDAATVKADFEGLVSASKDIDSVALVDLNGKFIVVNLPNELGQDVNFRDYFQVPVKEHRPYITSVAVSTLTNKPSIFFSAPVLSTAGKVLGVVRSRSSLAGVEKAVADARDRTGAGATGILLDPSGLVIADSEHADWQQRPIVPLPTDRLDALLKGKQWGNNSAPEPLNEQDLAQVIGTQDNKIVTWQSDGTLYHAVAQPLHVMPWTFVSALPVRTFDAAAREFLRNAVLAAIVGLMLGAALLLVFARSIAANLKSLTRTAQALAQGELDQEIDVKSNDEIGQVAAAFRSMIVYQQAMAEVAASIADGDLTREAMPQSERDVLGTSLLRMVSNLRELVGAVQTASSGVAEASHQLSGSGAQVGSVVQQVSRAIQSMANGAQDVNLSAQEGEQVVELLARAIDGIARGATDQARQVQAASLTANDLAAAVAEVASGAEQVGQASQQTRGAAQNGGRAVRETTAAMAQIQAVVGDAAAKVEDLGKLGDKIGAVIETIDDIAEQTNLLALNAAIEAARAGEHGRGFAVVADEVRKLAERSSRETKQIAELIQHVQVGTRGAVSAMQAGSLQVEQGAQKAELAGRALEEILAAVEATVAQVTDIATSAREMAQGAQRVTDSMESISVIVEENTAASEEMLAQSGHVAQAIKSIAGVAEEQSAGSEEVSASAEEMSAQIEEMSAQAQQLAVTASELRELVSRFKLDECGVVQLNPGALRRAA